MLQCQPFVLSFPPARVCPFLSLLFFCPSFFPVWTSLCLCLYLPFSFFAFCYLLLFFLLRLIFLVFCLLVVSFLASLVSLVAEYVCFFLFLLLSLFYTPHEAFEPEICKKLRILLCVLSCFLAFYCFLAWLELFFSLFPLGCVFFFDFWSRFSTSSCYFRPVYFFSG